MVEEAHAARLNKRNGRDWGAQISIGEVRRMAREWTEEMQDGEAHGL